MTALDLDPKATALVVIDLQRGIVSRDVAPHSSRDVVARSARLAEALRRAGGRSCSYASPTRPTRATG